MDKKEAEAIVSHADLTAPVRLILGYRSTDKNVSLSRVALASDAQVMFKKIATNILKNQKKRDPEDWAPARPVAPETYLVTTCSAVGNVPKVASSNVQPLLSALIDTDPIPEVDGDALRKTDPYFYAFQFSTGGTSLSFLRKINPMRGLRKKKLTLLDDELTLVNHAVFAFDDFADMIVTPTHVMIFNQTAFAAIFRGQKELENMTKGWVYSIRATTPMSQTSHTLLLAKAKSDSRVSKRIESISRRGHLANLGVEDLRRGMERCELDPELYINSANELEFDEKSLPEVLKFLNEDMFRGVLTDDPFEVDSKAPRN